jgi:hypothetical protein
MMTFSIRLSEAMYAHRATALDVASETDPAGCSAADVFAVRFAIGENWVVVGPQDLRFLHGVLGAYLLSKKSPGDVEDSSVGAPPSATRCPLCGDTGTRVVSGQPSFCDCAAGRLERNRRALKWSGRRDVWGKLQMRHRKSIAECLLALDDLADVIRADPHDSATQLAQANIAAAVWLLRRDELLDFCKKRVGDGSPEEERG